MNSERRKYIQEISTKLLELEDLKNSLYFMIEEVQDEEQEYYDNMPEGLQGSDRGYVAESALSNLEEALSTLDDLDIDSIRGNLEEAAS